MEIRVSSKGQEIFSNCKTKKKVFENQVEKFRYIINFLNDKANAKTSKDNISHIRGARFMFYRNGDPFDIVEFSIGGDSKDVDVLMKVTFGS
jgi:hypothetical protein